MDCIAFFKIDTAITVLMEDLISIFSSIGRMIPEDFTEMSSLIKGREIAEEIMISIITQ